MKSSFRNRDTFVDTKTMFGLNPRRHLPNYAHETAKLPSFQLPLDEGSGLFSDEDSSTDQSDSSTSDVISASSSFSSSSDESMASNSDQNDHAVTFRIKRQKRPFSPMRSKSDDLSMMTSPTKSPMIRKARTFDECPVTMAPAFADASPPSRSRDLFPSSRSVKRRSIQVRATEDVSEVSLIEIDSIHSRSARSFKSFADSGHSRSQSSWSEDYSWSARPLPMIPASPRSQVPPVKDEGDASVQSAGQATTKASSLAVAVESVPIKHHHMESTSKFWNREALLSPPPSLSPMPSSPTKLGKEISKLSAFFEGKSAANKFAMPMTPRDGNKWKCKVSPRKFSHERLKLRNSERASAPETSPPVVSSTVSTSLAPDSHPTSPIVKRGQVAQATSAYLSPKKTIQDCLKQPTPSSSQGTPFKPRRVAGKISSVLTIFESKSRSRSPSPDHSRQSSPVRARRGTSPRRSPLEHIREKYELPIRSTSQAIISSGRIKVSDKLMVPTMDDAVGQRDAPSSPGKSPSLMKSRFNDQSNSSLLLRDQKANGSERLNKTYGYSSSPKPTPPQRLLSSKTLEEMHESLSQLDDSILDASSSSLEASRSYLPMEKKASRPSSSLGSRRATHLRQQSDESSSFFSESQDPIDSESSMSPRKAPSRRTMRKQYVCMENTRPMGFHFMASSDSIRSTRSALDESMRSISTRGDEMDNRRESSLVLSSGAAKRFASGGKGNRIQDLIKAMGMR